MLSIHETATISRLADIENSVRNTRIIIEANVLIDSFVKIKAVGGEGDIVIGEGSNVNSGTVIYSGNGIWIGRNVLIAANCTLAPVNHAFSSRDKPIKMQRFMPSRGGIVIEDDVWVGANSVLLDGARLSQGCVIGAGSVVRGTVPAYTVNVGVPLRQIGERR